MEEVEPFTDVRAISSSLEADGIELTAGIDPESTKGAASIMLSDPDGNLILIDQFR